jgi:hypothetical protein
MATFNYSIFSNYYCCSIIQLVSLIILKPYICQCRVRCLCQCFIVMQATIIHRNDISILHSFSYTTVEYIEEHKQLKFSNLCNCINQEATPSLKVYNSFGFLHWFFFCWNLKLKLQIVAQIKIPTLLHETFFSSQHNWVCLEWIVLFFSLCKKVYANK